MHFDEWLNKIAPVLGRQRLERLLNAQIENAEFTVRRGCAVYSVRARRRADTIEMFDVTAEDYASKRIVMREIYRSTGIICFDYNAELDELTAACAKGEHSIQDFSKGTYGPLVRMISASNAQSGSASTDLGRIWYTCLSTGKAGPRKYVGVLIPEKAEAESDLDRTHDMEYTECLDEDRQRIERYRLLGEDAGVVTLDYDPKKDVLVYSAVPQEDVRVESIVGNYMTDMAESHVIAQESHEIFRINLLRAMNGASSGSFEYRADFFGEGYRWYRLRYVSAADEDGCVYRVVGRADEIEKEIADRADLLEGALNDGVTGLYNRRTAQRLIESALAERGTMRYDALFMIDIDDFKQINDTRGHLQGDIALRKVAEAIRSVFREADIKGRFGGDEFVVYMRAFSDPALPSVVARRLMNRLSMDCEKLTCSVGVALVQEPSRFEEVVMRADDALYRAKRANKCCFAVGGEIITK